MRGQAERATGSAPGSAPGSATEDARGCAAGGLAPPDAPGRPGVIRRVACLLAATLLLAGCFAQVGPPRLGPELPTVTSGRFVMPDGAVLPYRDWLPKGQPQAVVLALHGMNDSRDAWEYPAPDLQAAGMAVFAPDLPGFGATADRGEWPGTERITDDVRMMVRELRARYPHTRLILMGESMGGAALMVLATEPDPPKVDGYVLVAPAVWGEQEMNVLMRATLWVADHTFPGLTLTGRGFVRVTASDNREALIRLSEDRLTIHATRVDAIRGLVTLMGQALTAASHFDAPALFLYGGRDELVPPRATAAAWRALPSGGEADPVLAFYPNGYHLLLRDKKRAQPIGDIVSWIRNPHAPLPSGAQQAASAWLVRQNAKNS